MTNVAMPVRFLVGGLSFFAVCFLLGFVLLLLAPLDVIRAFCALALTGATAGIALHLGALRVMHPESFAALRRRFAALPLRASRAAIRVTVSARDAAVAGGGWIADSAASERFRQWFGRLAAARRQVVRRHAEDIIN